MLQFDFSNYVRRLYLLANVVLRDDDIVIIHKISNIRNISSLLAKQTPEDLQMYMIGYFLLPLFFHMPSRFRTMLNIPTTDQSNVHVDESRSMGCAKYVKRNMQYAVSKLYIDKYHDQRARNEVFPTIALHACTHYLLCEFSDR